jgi:hypothetical protein
MVEVPAEIPVTIPVAEVTVATPAFALDQVPTLVVEVSVEVKPTQTAVVPEIVPATGAAVTVTVLVAVALGQPLAPATVYVMVAVPGAIPVTTPEEFTEAMEAAVLVQVPPVTVEVKVVVLPTQIDCVPERVPALAFGVTVTVTTLEFPLITVDPLTISSASR